MDDNLTRDIYERLGGIEAKLDDVRQIRDTANRAEKEAEIAHRQSKVNSKDLEKLTGTIKWGFGLIVAVVIPISIAVLNLVVGG